jgi:serine/threonine-protein kinase
VRDRRVDPRASLSELPAWWGPVLPDGTRHRYLVTEHVSTTNWSDVYIARDCLDRDVVLKVLLAGDGIREARILAEHEHPHIVRVLTVDIIERHVCLVLERCREGDLLTHSRLWPWESVVDRCLEVAAALEHLHRSEIVHGDVKPGNVLIQDCRARLGDFGFARSTTRSGPIAGTPPFVPPERFAGHWEPAGDLFSLAYTLQECLAVARTRPPARVLRAVEAGLTPLTDMRPSLREWAARVSAARSPSLVRRLLRRDREQLASLMECP